MDAINTAKYKMHIPTVLYGYNVQAFRLPFMTQHSPSLLADDLNNYGRIIMTRTQYWRTAMKNTTTMGTAYQGH